MDTLTNDNKFDKILVLKQRGVQKSDLVPMFEKALIMYNSCFYYIDQLNKDVYFLGSVIQSPGVNGKISIRYYLEKYSITKGVLVFESNFDTIHTSNTKVQYSLSDDGYVFVETGDKKISKVDLRKLTPTTKWWD